MGIQDSSHSHVDSMCGDGQSKLYYNIMHETYINTLQHIIYLNNTEKVLPILAKVTS